MQCVLSLRPLMPVRVPQVWRGVFSADRPVVGEGDSFAPRQAGMAIAVEDLVSEEEVPAAAARGVANVLAVYNSDLRALYDKYCRRPSLHLRHDVPRPSFTMVTCQVWELASDARLVTAGTPLARLDGWLERARRPPEALAAFRAQAAAAMEVVRAAGATHADLGDGGELAQGLGGSEVFWEELAHAHVRGGLHAPLQELLFREFCEACVRIAAARYRHIPGLERRLHTLINAHLLHQVGNERGQAVLFTPHNSDPYPSTCAVAGCNTHKTGTSQPMPHPRLHLHRWPKPRRPCLPHPARPCIRSCGQGRPSPRCRAVRRCCRLRGGGWWARWTHPPTHTQSPPLTLSRPLLAVRTGRAVRMCSPS